MVVVVNVGFVVIIIIRSYFGHKIFVMGEKTYVMRRQDLLDRQVFDAISLDRHAKRRVESYTLAGVPCIIAGLNRHAGDFTMPSHWRVRDLFDPKHAWIRQATEEEKAQHGKWYHVLNFKPAAVIHSNGTVAGRHDTLGLVGNRITVLAQAPVETLEEVCRRRRCPDTPDSASPEIHAKMLVSGEEFSRSSSKSHPRRTSVSLVELPILHEDLLLSEIPS